MPHMLGEVTRKNPIGAGSELAEGCARLAQNPHLAVNHLDLSTWTQDPDGSAFQAARDLRTIGSARKSVVANRLK